MSPDARGSSSMTQQRRAIFLGVFKCCPGFVIEASLLSGSRRYGQFQLIEGRGGGDFKTGVLAIYEIEASAQVRETDASAFAFGLVLPVVIAVLPAVGSDA